MSNIFTKVSPRINATAIILTPLSPRPNDPFNAVGSAIASPAMEPGPLTKNPENPLIKLTIGE